AEDGIRDRNVTGVQTCALPISRGRRSFFRPNVVQYTQQQTCPALRAGEGGEILCWKTAPLPPWRRPPAREASRWCGCRGRRASEIGRASCRERGESWGVEQARE